VLLPLPSPVLTMTMPRRGVGGRIAAAAVVHHAPVVHHHQLVRGQRHRQLVQHADHGAAPGDVLAHQRQPVGLVRWVEVGQRLVHQQHGGFDRQARASSTRWRSPPDSSPSVRPRHSQHCVAAHRAFDGGVVGARRRCQPGLVRQAPEQHHVAGTKVLGAGLRLPKPGHRAAAFARAPGGLRPAEQLDRAARGQQVRQRLQQRGLAGAVGTDHGGPAAGRQGHVDAMQHLAASERDAKVFGGESNTHGETSALRAAVL
jgi:hypothetical protein